jgi:hypothetical protein
MAWNIGDFLNRLVVGVGTTNIPTLLRRGLEIRSDNRAYRDSPHGHGHGDTKIRSN